MAETLRAAVEKLAEEWERRADKVRVRGYPEAAAADMQERDTLNACAEALRALLAADEPAPRETGETE